MKREAESIRFWGVDFLRLIAMLFVVIIHTYYHGGILSSVDLGSGQYYSSYFVYAIVVCGVDTFAVISGFVGFKESENGKYGLEKFINLWIITVFYCLLISSSFHFVFKDSSTHILQSFFPLSNNTYWYLTAYLFVYLMTPILNWLLRTLDENKIMILLICGTAFLYLSHTMSGLFSKVLLVYLYILGAIIRKYSLYKKFDRIKLIFATTALILASWIWCTAIGKAYNMTIGELSLRYDSPSIILIAVFLVMLFAGLQINGWLRKFTQAFSACSFSVYILNDNPLVREHFISENFEWLCSESVVRLLFVSVGFSFLFFCFSLLIDRLRMYLFSITHADKLGALIWRGIQYIALRLGKVLVCFSNLLKIK